MIYEASHCGSFTHNGYLGASRDHVTHALIQCNDEQKPVTKIEMSPSVFAYFIRSYQATWGNPPSLNLSIYGVPVKCLNKDEIPKDSDPVVLIYNEDGVVGKLSGWMA